MAFRGYDLRTYETTRRALADGSTITYDPQRMEKLDMYAVAYAMLDHVTKCHEKRNAP